MKLINYNWKIEVEKYLKSKHLKNFNQTFSNDRVI